jgi:hypothetical protein
VGGAGDFTFTSTAQFTQFRIMQIWIYVVYLGMFSIYVVKNLHLMHSETNPWSAMPEIPSPLWQNTYSVTCCLQCRTSVGTQSLVTFQCDQPVSMWIHNEQTYHVTVVHWWNALPFHYVQQAFCYFLHKI